MPTVVTCLAWTAKSTTYLTPSMRIISGQWRGHKLNPPTDVQALKPTKDFIREVLFNWLRDDITDARVLDCFAGSGILSLESISRGAQYADMWEIDPTLVRWLQSLSQRFDHNRLRVHRCDAQQYDPQPKQNYTVVFLDPPFGLSKLVIPNLLNRLLTSKLLAPNAKIYIESSWQDNGLTPLFHCLKQKRSGRVFASLYELTLDTN